MIEYQPQQFLISESVFSNQDYKFVYGYKEIQGANEEGFMTRDHVWLVNFKQFHPFD